MKVSSLVLAGFLSSGTCNAFVAPKTFQVASPLSTSLYSLAPTASSGRSKGGRSEEEIHSEVSSGKVLEGGKVIDFEAIKGPSGAEKALLEAKNEILASGKKYVPADSGILGINSDVIALVGHDLGIFASSDEIQNCASYLRSMAPGGFFEQHEGVNGEINGEAKAFTAAQKTGFNELLLKAYFESGEVTGAFAKTFFLGTQLLPEAPREAIWAIYVWCRRTDEIVDAPRENDEEMIKDLASWEMRLENLWKYGQVEDVFDLCMLDVLVKYPTLPIMPFVDMIRGMLMDVPGLGQDRYDGFDELHLYCYRVAGTVGLMSLPVFGCAEGYNDVIAK
jgi:phytoene synthase